jgi:hypothetical protein
MFGGCYLRKSKENVPEESRGIASTELTQQVKMIDEPPRQVEA